MLQKIDVGIVELPFLVFAVIATRLAYAPEKAVDLVETFASRFEVSQALTGQEGESDRSSRWLVTHSAKAEENVCHYDPRVMAAC